jgi:hypothetical protein
MRECALFDLPRVDFHVAARQLFDFRRSIHKESIRPCSI